MRNRSLLVPLLLLILAGAALADDLPDLVEVPPPLDLSPAGVKQRWSQAWSAASKRPDAEPADDQQKDEPGHKMYRVRFKDTGYVLRTDTCTRVTSYRPTVPAPYFSFSYQTVYIDDRSPIHIGLASHRLGSIEEQDKPDSFKGGGIFFNRPGRQKQYRRDEVEIEEIDGNDEFQGRLNRLAMDLFTSRLSSALTDRSKAVFSNQGRMQAYVTGVSPAQVDPVAALRDKLGSASDEFARTLKEAQDYASSKGVRELAGALDPSSPEVDRFVRDAVAYEGVIRLVGRALEEWWEYYETVGRR